MSENEKGGYGLVYQSVMRDGNLSVKTKAVYAYLSCYAGSKNECYPSRRLILNDLNICGETLDICVKELISRGYIEKIQVREKGKFSKNLYRINHAGRESLPEKPCTEKPCTEKPLPTKPDANNIIINNNSLNNNSINKNKKLYSSDEEYNQKDKPFCGQTENGGEEFENTEAEKIEFSQGEESESCGESLSVLKTAEDQPEDGSYSKTRKPRSRKTTGILTKEQQKRFDIFWEAYPNKKSPGQAEKTFAKLCPDEDLFKEIMNGVERAKKYDFRFRDKRYTPHPSSWLNAKGWLDRFDSENGDSGAESGAYGLKKSTGNIFFDMLGGAEIDT